MASKLLYLLHEKKAGTCYISALSCHTASCRAVHKCLKQDQNYKTKTKTKAGLRSVLSYDRGLRLQDW